mmetsp:Transcript_34670/g.97762  ORF Transcript_34670/g.97762 Transcript_34670/m.97762 type:complete len:151 (-) Transcript_34670:730-1182(-)
MTSNGKVVADLVDDLVTNTAKCLTEGEVPGDLWVACQEMFTQSVVEKALFLIDSRLCGCYQSSPSGRRFYFVEGSLDGGRLGHRTIILHKHYCSCESFHENVVSLGSIPLCEHLLAIALIHNGGGKYGQTIGISDREFAFELNRHMERIL